jgi:hypothetical protein
VESFPGCWTARWSMMDLDRLLTSMMSLKDFWEILCGLTLVRLRGRMVIQWYLMASFLTRVGGNKNPATNSVLCQVFKVSHTTWGYSPKIRWCHTSGRFLLLDYPFFAANNSRKRLLVKNLSKACNNPHQNMSVVALGNAVKVPVSIGHDPPWDFTTWVFHFQ